MKQMFFKIYIIMDWYEKFEKLKELIGDETMFCAITNYFSSDQIDDFCESLIVDYNLENEFE